MITALKNTSFKPLKTLGKTLYQWREEVVRMWRFTKNNGIIEGFHRKMKLIQRRAYGFRTLKITDYELKYFVLETVPPKVGKTRNLELKNFLQWVLI